jgi:pSer/pThr/pTyr-binding forkhead associated (FHA) protein
MSQLLSEPLVAESPSLVYESEHGQPIKFCLDGRARVTVGRAGQCDLVLTDSGVSRRHASIEAIDGQHLLKDEGSSNGTFLNGLRLNARSGFALRPGDVIEVGNRRLVYSTGETPAPAAGEPDSTFSLPELTRDGYAQLEALDRRDLQVAVQKTFEGTTRMAALDHCVALISEALEAPLVALFTKEAGSTRPVAASRSFEHARSLVAFAEAVGESRAALLHVGGGAPGPYSVGETQSTMFESVTAVPLLRGSTCMGALVAVRNALRRFDRSEVALLAVYADRIAIALSLQGKTPGDTRPGYAA